MESQSDVILCEIIYYSLAFCAPMFFFFQLLCHMRRYDVQMKLCMCWMTNINVNMTGIVADVNLPVCTACSRGTKYKCVT